MKIKLASIPVCLGWDSCEHIPSSELLPAEAAEEEGSGFLRGVASGKLPSSEKDAVQTGSSEIQRKETAMKFEGTMGG